MGAGAVKVKFRDWLVEILMPNNLPLPVGDMVLFA